MPIEKCRALIAVSLCGLGAFCGFAHAEETSTTPSLEFASYSSTEIGSHPESRLQSWTVHSTAVSEATVRLVQIVGGIVKPIEARELLWDKNAAKPSTWNISVLFAGQKARVGSSDKVYLPYLGTGKTDEGGDSSYPETTASLDGKSVVIQDSGVMVAQSYLTHRTFQQPGEIVLYQYQYDIPQLEKLKNLKFATTLNDLVQASRGGKKFVAVVVNWKAMPAAAPTTAAK